ncbi:MAG: hypothetical protein R2705_21895 [Ilumatobacteraceae bacterium]
MDRPRRQGLGWDRANIIYGPFDILKPDSLWRLEPDHAAVRGRATIIVVLIHVYFFGLLIFIWTWWQKRGDNVTKELPTSSYGRPLVKKA